MRYTLFRALIIVLALLAIAQSGVLVYYTVLSYPAELHAQATAVVRTRLTARSQILKQATAAVNTLTPQEIYNQVTSETPTINDPLDKGGTLAWFAYSFPGYSCNFTGGAYHASMSIENNQSRCIAVEPHLSNFAFQIRITFIRGDGGGGLTFRTANESDRGYFFGFSQNGDYSLSVRQDNSNDKLLASGSSIGVISDLNQSCLLAVIADGSSFYLYVNRRYIREVKDNTYQSGTIGSYVFAHKKPTEVAFNNVQVWSL